MTNSLEFIKNVVADYGFRFMECTGGLNSGKVIVPLFGCVWKDGKKSPPNKYRKFTDLRAPIWVIQVRDGIQRRRKEQKNAEWTLSGR